MKIKFALMALLATFFALPSRADSISYSLDFNFDSEVATFTIPVNPVTSNSNSTEFTILGVPGGLGSFGYSFDVTMRGTDLRIVIDDIERLPLLLADLSENSSPLYSGSTANPTLLPGTFRFLSGFGTPSTLTAKLIPSTSAMPEPRSLELVAAGMLALIIKFRR